jgi:ketosteroid isomerase-like protein
VFGNVDRDGARIVRGAFAGRRSLAGRTVPLQCDPPGGRLGRQGLLATLPSRRDTGRAMSPENVEIVRRFLVVDDFDVALTYADPDIVWNPVEESSAQGHDAVRASTARWKSEWNDYVLIPEELADMGDRVVATVRFRARGRGSGIEVDARLYDLFTLRDGKIVRMDQFTEQSEALEAAGLRE